MPLRKPTGTPILPPAAEAARPAAVTAAAPVVLDVPLITQQQNQWCWAACTAMVAKHLGLDDLRQCELANFLHRQTRCCDRPGAAYCNLPCPPGDIMRVFRHAGMDGLGPDRPLLAPTLVAELTAGRPVEAGLYWFGGGGHVVIVYGMTARGLFLVHDPWYRSGTVTYAGLAGAYGRGRWALSFGRFRRV